MDTFPSVYPIATKETSGSAPCPPRKTEITRHPPRRRLTTSWRKCSSASLVAVVRHTERADDVSSLFHGAPWGLTEDAKQWPMDPPLSDDGVRMAYDVGKDLKEIAHAIGSKFQVLITSPYFRCVQTAVEICRHLGPTCRLLIDHSLGEVFSPDIFGDVQPQLILRSSSQTVQLCHANAVSGRRLKKPLGKKPVWPENAGIGKVRLADSFDKYMCRSVVANKNFILVTHGDGVAGAFESIQNIRKVDSVAYGAFFCAHHRCEDDRGSRHTALDHRWKIQARGIAFRVVLADLVDSDDFVESPKEILSGTKSLPPAEQFIPQGTLDSPASSATNFFCMSDVDDLSSPTSSPTQKRSDSDLDPSLPVLLGRISQQTCATIAEKPKELGLRLENSALHRKRKTSKDSKSSLASE